MLAVPSNVNLGFLMLVYFQPSFSLAVRGVNWSALRPGRFNPT